MIAKKTESTLKEKAVSYRILEFGSCFESTQHAAEMIQTPVERIAKTLVFYASFRVIAVITSDTAKVDNQRFIGIANSKAQVYMDITVKHLADGQVFPSAGTDNGAIAILSDDLYTAVNCNGMVDVCK